MQNATAFSKPKAQSGIRYWSLEFAHENAKKTALNAQWAWSSNFLALIAKCTCSLGWWAQKQTPYPTHICMSCPCNSFLRCNLLHGSAVANSKYLVDRMVAHVTPLASSLCFKPVQVCTIEHLMSWTRSHMCWVPSGCEDKALGRNLPDVFNRSGKSFADEDATMR